MSNFVTSPVTIPTAGTDKMHNLTALVTVRFLLDNLPYRMSLFGLVE